MKALFMETTTIPPERTAGEITSQLIRAGATQISTSYTGGKITGLRWIMTVSGGDALFEMPARVEPIYVILARRKGHKTGRNSMGVVVYPELWVKAERVAWRQLLRWIQAQNAMIETGMVQPMEVFTAYWIPPGHTRTLFETMVESRFKALPAPSAS